MELDIVKENSKKMLTEFVDKLGYDGEFFASISNCPVIWEYIFEE